MDIMRQSALLVINIIMVYTSIFFQMHNGGPDLRLNEDTDVCLCPPPPPPVAQLKIFFRSYRL